MRTMTSEKFGQICDGVWRDRAGILTMRGALSGEAALVRAVYWRLCKAGGELGKSIEDCDTDHKLLMYEQLVGSMLTQYAHPHFDGTPLLKDLVRRHMDEAGQVR